MQLCWFICPISSRTMVTLILSYFVNWEIHTVQQKHKICKVYCLKYLGTILNIVTCNIINVLDAVTTIQRHATKRMLPMGIKHRTFPCNIDACTTELRLTLLLATNVFPL